MSARSPHRFRSFRSFAHSSSSLCLVAWIAVGCGADGDNLFGNTGSRDAGDDSSGGTDSSGTGGTPGAAGTISIGGASSGGSNASTAGSPNASGGVSATDSGGGIPNTDAGSAGTGNGGNAAGGSGGTGDADGGGPLLPKDRIMCGAQYCNRGSTEVCCVDNSGVPACVPSNDTSSCDYVIGCDNDEHCPGQVCCGTQAVSDDSMTDSSCQDDCGEGLDSIHPFQCTGPDTCGDGTICCADIHALYDHIVSISCEAPSSCDYPDVVICVTDDDCQSWESCQVDNDISHSLYSCQ